MHLNWVNPTDLGSYINPALFEPNLLRWKKKLKKQNILGQLADHTNNLSGFAFSSSLFSEIPNEPKVVRIGDLDDSILDSSNCISLVEDYTVEKKYIISNEAVFVAMTGATVGKTGYKISKEKVTPNQRVLALTPNENSDLGYIFICLLNPKVRQQIEAFASGVAQPNISSDQIIASNIPTASYEVQKAIGNKVRKAEGLRKLADIMIRKANNLINTNLGLIEIHNKKAYWVAPSLIHKRLDCGFNSYKRIEILRYLSESNFQVDRLSKLFVISAMIGWKGLNTSFYRDNGPYLIRGVDYASGILNLANTFRVDHKKFMEQPQIHLRENDILLTKDGSRLGKALAMPKINNLACAGSTVARLRPRVLLDSYFVELIINHYICQKQIKSLITGMAQPHLTQEWLEEILIPRFENEDEIGGLNKEYKRLFIESIELIEASKLDVENLSKGSLNIDALLAEGAEIDNWLKENQSPYTEVNQ